MTHRFKAAAFLCAFAFAGMPFAAVAHAFLHVAIPAVGSTIRTAPSTVEIEFTEGIEPAFSSIRVEDAQGVRVDRGNTHREGPDTHLAVGLKTLSPGSYKVMWQATATDTHHTQGSFTFTVVP
jgi:methionine-rich copper-binding protein CopC